MFVLRNYTVENLFPTDTKFSGYDDISYLPSDESQLVWLYQTPVGFNAENKISAIKAMWEKLQLVIQRLEAHQSLVICELLDMFPIQEVDSDNRLSDAVIEFNRKARTLCGNSIAVKFLSISEYFKRYPVSEWINWRFYFISQMIVAPSVASGFYDWFSNRLSQLNGARKKCLVLDLDNTLWGGVLGEDGIEGIKIGGDYPGNAFLYFQEALIELSKTGVILTVCSKNNESDVKEAWDKNPFIKLKEHYISAYRINWNNKADNIIELAKELNIGLDSMVFVDDNPTERELIRQQLPMVAVPDFPQKPYGLMNLYRELATEYFRAYSLSDEDRKKTEQYKANAQRANAGRQFSDLTDFIKSLDIRIEIVPADKFNIQRIAQMTQKTNQFNLTTHRYSEADINAFVEKGDYVWCISVSDKFGDNGITGTIIVTRDGDIASVDTLLLSCRILGKGIENAFFKTILNMLRSSGIKKVQATYLPTAKNSQVSDFYDRQGMTRIADVDGMKSYEIKLDQELAIPEYYKININ